MWILLVGLTMLASSSRAVELSDEMKEMAKMLHDTCVDETKVDESLIDKVASGQFADDGKLKCYFKCLFGQLGALSDEGQLDTEAFQAVIPEDLQAAYTKMVSACKGKDTGSDVCDASYNFYKCLYEVDPANFITF